MTAATIARPTTHKSVLAVAAAAALGGFLFCFDTAIVNGAGDAIQHVFHLGPSAKGFVVSSALLGCVVGAWFAGPLADRLGRIRTMVIAATIFLLSAVGSALSFSAWELTAWRVFADRLGRIRTMVIAATIFLLSAVGSA